MRIGIGRQGPMRYPPTEMRFRGPAAAALALAALTATAPARADGPLGSNGTLIRTSEYTVDLSHGLVLDGSRPTGLGGAYVAIAEGVDGMLQNPASPAHRLPYSFSDFDYDVGAGITFPTTVASGDYFNSGRSTTDFGTQAEREGFLFLNAAGLVQWGKWGLGAALDLQNYGLRRSQDPSVGSKQDRLYARFVVSHVQLARRLGGVILGGGLRLSTLSVIRQQAGASIETELFSVTGTALEAGLLWRPTSLPLRLGASVHSAFTTEPARGSNSIQSVSGDFIVPDPDDPSNPDAPNVFYLPQRLSQPWGIDLGAAVQLGPRPLNPPWVNPARVTARLRRYLAWRRLERRRRRDSELRRIKQRGGDVSAARAALDSQIAIEDELDAAQLEREAHRVVQGLRASYARLQRFYVLVAASVRITGPVPDGVGVESFLQQRVDRAGQRVTFSPRLGLESEVVPNWLRARAGTYVEPTRFSNPNAAARLHTTVGLDVRLFSWTVFSLLPQGTSFRAGGFVDAAPRYFGWGLSVGVWH